MEFIFAILLVIVGIAWLVEKTQKSNLENRLKFISKKNIKNLSTVLDSVRQCRTRNINELRISISNLLRFFGSGTYIQKEFRDVYQLVVGFAPRSNSRDDGVVPDDKYEQFFLLQMLIVRVSIFKMQAQLPIMT